MPRKPKQVSEEKKEEINVQPEKVSRPIGSPKSPPKVPEKVESSTKSTPVPVKEKQKRKARFEAGSIEAKEHMKKLRELKAQKRAAIVS